ncbi:Adenylate cyclase [Minicystis rosea]|nr:Adenylate cyclase [Minicystis rosea]
MDWVPLVGGGADLSQQVLVLGDRRVRLTSKERDLLAYLAQNPGRTITRRELLVNVWGSPAHASDEPVYSVVKRLRAKIDRGAHRHIQGVHGDGYRWAPAPEAAPPPAPASSGARETRFFGREMEVRALAGAFAAGARLVTFVGPAGVGKTRCAREAAAGVPHVFCDLASATSEERVVAAVAAALCIPLDGADVSAWALGVGRALGAIPDHLVVLDNAEQAIDAVAAVALRWSTAGPRLLVTSREPLRIAAEQVIPIEPLSPADAEALFVDRSAAAGGDSGDAATHALIVDRVDRLPLAVELAAAQVPHLGARALLDSLDAQLATLVVGMRDAPRRHATLRAAVEWSWTLLEPREREVLGALSVFAGSFTLDAARAVVGADDAAAVIAGLCRRCQIRRDGGRFTLYAAVRELARELSRDAAPGEARHAAHYARIGDAAVALLEGTRHLEGAATLATELGELRAAWEHARGRDAALAARLALAIERALGLSAARAGERRVLLAESRRGLDDPDLTCALLLAEARTDGAPLALLDEAAALATRPGVAAEIHLTRGERLAAVGLAAARDELGHALRLATEAGADSLRGRALAALGEVAWAHGLVAEASAKLRAALAVHVHVGDRRAVARTSALLAHVDRLETGGGAALALLDRAQAAADELGDPVVRARVLLDLGQHLTRAGDQAGARIALDEAAELYARLGFARERAFLHLHVAEVRVGMGDFELALDEALAALATLPDAGDVGRSTIHEAIGCVHLLRGDLAEAERWIEDGLVIARRSGAARSECTLLGKRGLLRLVTGSPERAFADFDAATQKNRARGSSTMEAASLADRAVASFTLGDEAHAVADLARARELLHHPPDDQTDGRMLAVCEIAGRGLGSVRAGAPPRDAHARARAETARFFHRTPPHEWDVVLRILDWMVEHVAVAPISLGA